MAGGRRQKARLVCIDRLLVALVHLRNAATHGMVACPFGVDQSTIRCAIGEMRSLLAQQDCTLPSNSVIDHVGKATTPESLTAFTSAVRCLATYARSRARSSRARADRTAVRSRVDPERLLRWSPDPPAGCADITQGPYVRAR
ncbi:transposase family protein [Streptomyces sp. NPDC059008]|uniref:transposase family protein n=1 Tax=Streptomyces sp. NPDC059008 TaxID=3346693 RepID=UPI00368EEEA3